MEKYLELVEHYSLGLYSIRITQVPFLLCFPVAILCIDKVQG